MALIVVAANSSWNISHFRLPLVRALLERGHEVITISPDKGAISVNDAEVSHRRCKMQRSGINPIGDIYYFCKLVLVLYRENPDFFLGFTIKPNIYGSLACRLLGLRSIPNISGLGTVFLGPSRVRKAVEFMYRVAFRRCKPIFFQNADDRALFLSENIVGAEQTKMLPGSGVDLERFSPCALPDGTAFLMVARLIGDKGVREYVEAARKVARIYPKAEFSLLGEIDNENRSAIGADELRGWGREGTIRYLGSTRDVRPFIRKSTAVVLPSYREGLPRALLEGAAMGRPLIGTDVPGCREIIREGMTGYLCRPRDVDSLADAMCRFASTSHAQRMRMGAQARQMVETEFDERFVIRAYLDVIDEPLRKVGSEPDSSTSRCAGESSP
jgi:glycosyltransferase involved in cell wall biosynthesis